MVTLDLLGHGRSDRPEDPKEYSMTAWGEQVVALLDHLGAEQAVVGGTSLGRQRQPRGRRRSRRSGCRGCCSRCRCSTTPSRPGIIAFAPLLFLARFFPPGDRGWWRPARRLVPRRLAPLLGRRRPRHARPAARADGRGRSTGSSSAGSRRRAGCAGSIEAPALVVGHPRDPIHLAADAVMVAEEMPNARYVERLEHPRVAAPPGAARRGGDRVRHRRRGRAPPARTPRQA